MLSYINFLIYHEPYILGLPLNPTLKMKVSQKKKLFQNVKI